MNEPRVSGKLIGLALLVFLGASLIALAFVPGPGNRGSAFPPQIMAWGVVCLFVAGIWLWWDRKRRRLTPDEQTEQLLYAAIKRYRRIGTWEGVIAEYRALGASEEELENIREAKQTLRIRGEAKITMGCQLLATGVILTVIMYFVGKWIGFHHYEVQIGAIGGGAGFIADGIRQRNAARGD